MTKELKAHPNVLRRSAAFASMAVFATTLCAQDHSIETLVANADSVVVGSVATRTETADTIAFDINVGSTLKGSAVPAVVHINHARQSTGVQPLGVIDGAVIQASLGGLWFLSHHNDGTWDVLPVEGRNDSIVSLFLPGIASAPAAFQLTGGAAPIDLVTLSLFATVADKGYDPDFLLGEISQPNRTSARLAFSNFAVSTNPSLQCVGIAGLLRAQDSSTIAALPALWPKVKDSACSALIREAVRDDLRPTSSTAVSGLVAVAASIPELRSETINAIAAVHTPDSLGFLAGLLSSTSADEQMKAVFGLGAFANGCPPQTRDNISSLAFLRIPASAPYQTPETIANFGFRRGQDGEEASLVHFWLGWWSVHPELH